MFSLLCTYSCKLSLTVSGFSVAGVLVPDLLVQDPMPAMMEHPVKNKAALVNLFMVIFYNAPKLGKNISRA